MGTIRPRLESPTCGRDARSGRCAYGPPPDPDSDRTAALRIQGLVPGTRYGYAVDLAAEGRRPVFDLARGSFRTLPPEGQKGKLRFAVGADITGKHRQPIFDRMREQAPDLALLIGDQVYADRAADYKGYRIRGRASRLRALRAFPRSACVSRRGALLRVPRARRGVLRARRAHVPIIARRGRWSEQDHASWTSTRAPSRSMALTLCSGDRPCNAGREPAPETALDVEGDAENVPFTVRLIGRDLGLAR